MNLKNKAAAAAITLALLTGGTALAKGGDAKQTALVPMQCSTPVALVHTGYNKSGDRVTFTAGARQDSSGQVWRVTVTDAGVTLVDQTFPFPSSDWSILANYRSPKGERVVSVTATTGDGSTVCKQTLTYKV